MVSLSLIILLESSDTAPVASNKKSSERAIPIDAKGESVAGISAFQVIAGNVLASVSP